MKNKKTRVLLAIFVLTALAIFPITRSQAAALTSVSDTLSTLTQNTAANHTILFVTPTGVQVSGDQITIDFTDFTVGSVDFTDIDIAEDDDGGCDGTWTDKTVAATAAAGAWGAAFSGSSLELDPPTDAASGEIDAGFCVQIQIGTNAASGDQQLTNPNDTNTHVVEIAGAFGDSGSFAVDFVSDDSVNISATVDPTLAFTISDTAIGFGNLSDSTGRWATADALGGNASNPALPTAAHTMTVATNATGGWAITYNGATLTSGANTIDVASVDEDSDGTPGTEEFGVAVSTNGDSTVATGYLRDTASDFTFVAGTTTTIISEAAPTSTETISASYLANIAGNTEAGSYATDVTYIATATF